LDIGLTKVTVLNTTTGLEKEIQQKIIKRKNDKIFDPKRKREQMALIWLSVCAG
jgi:hypothetical protein